MKSRFYMLLVVLVLVLLSGCSSKVEINKELNCDGLKACELKICNLKNDIYNAKLANNDNRVDGLVISLNKVQKYCTDEGLIEEIEDKISDTKKDLKEALGDNRADKINKYKTKMDEEIQKIEELEEKLKQLK